MFTTKTKLFLYIVLISMIIFSYILILYFKDEKEIYLYNPKIISIHWKFIDKKKNESPSEVQKEYPNDYFYQFKFKKHFTFIFNSKELIYIKNNDEIKVLNLSDSDIGKEFKISIEEYLKKEKKNIIEKFLIKSFNPKTSHYNFSKWESIIDFEIDKEENLYLIILEKENLYLSLVDRDINLKYQIPLKEISFGNESILSINISHDSKIYIVTKEILESNQNTINHHIYQYDMYGNFLQKIESLEKIINNKEIIEQISYIPESFKFIIISNMYNENPDKTIFLYYKNFYIYSVISKSMEYKKTFSEESKNIHNFKIMKDGSIYFSIPFHENEDTSLFKKYYFKIFNFKTRKVIGNRIYKIQKEIDNPNQKMTISEDSFPIFYEEKGNLFQIYNYSP